MQNYYTAVQVRALDRIAIDEFGIPGFTLMQRAAAACFQALRQSWPDARQVLVCCGTGNNGGDGLVLAVLCLQAGLSVKVFLSGDQSSMQGDALKALDMARQHDVAIEQAENLAACLDAPHRQRVLVDALLGTGLSGKVREPFAGLIGLINASGYPVLAVDIPSGLCSDSGMVLGAAVKADTTVTFIGRKLGMIRGQGPVYCGSCVFADLSVPEPVYQKLASSPVRE